jgi:peptidoglycan/xylan/chitin deacetylase (PgdA/CDA1 family)
MSRSLRLAPNGSAEAAPPVLRELPGHRRGAAKRWLEAALSLVFFVLWSGWHRIARLCGFARPRLVILYYHAVPADCRARFARQLDAIRAGADAVVPADFRGPAKPAQLLVAITFDDAFTSVIDNALPELAARAMTATIFAPSGMLDRHPGWNMGESAPDRLETVASPDMLRALPPHAVAIGAHSVTHPCLPALDRSAAAAEIAGSKSDLARLLGREVEGFAFPYGEYDDATVALCRTAGYRFAYTTLPHTLDPADGSFLRGRVAVQLSDTRLEFWLKLRGAYSWLAPVRRLKRRLRSRAAPPP